MHRIYVNNDGVNTERARRVLIDRYYVSAGADNSSDKANGKSGTMAFGFERDVQDITRRDGVFYSMAKSQKFGTESDADYMERFLFENMFVVRATGGPQAHLSDRATLRDFTARNWHVDSGTRLIEMNVAPWGGRDPTTANMRDMRFENIFAHINGTVQFGTFDANTPIRDVELSNIWQAGQFATSTATMNLGTHADGSTFTVSVDPSIWAAHDRYGRVGEPVPMNAYFVDALGNWSSHQGPGSYAVTWTVQSGPGTVTFSNAKDPQTTATFSQRGEYVLRLTADNHPAVYDELTVTVLDPAFTGEPLARFVAFPTIPQRNQPVTFDASFSSDPDGTIVSYTWDFGDGTTVTTASATTTHTFAAASIHEVHLTVTDNEGNSRRIRDWMVVRERERTPFGGVAHTVPGRIQIEYFDDGSPGIAFLDRSAGAVDPNDPYKPDPAAYRAPPEFIEEYFATRFPDIRPTSDPENPGGHELYDINTPSGPTLEFVSYTLNVTQTGTYEMRIRMNPDTANVDRRFNVYLNDVLVASERTWGRRTHWDITTVPNLPLNETGEQILKIEFLGSLGSNGGINYFDLVRTGAPVPTAAFTVSPERGLVPLLITVDASGSSGSGEAITRYDWNFGDGTVIANGNAVETHTYTTEGTFSISLTVTNESGNTATSTISYFAGNQPPLASLTHAPTFGEPPLEVTFDASGSSDPDGHIVRFDWDFGDGHTVIDGGAVVSRTYTTLGSYTATVTVHDNDGATAQASVVVQVTDGSLLTPDITQWPVASPIVEGETLAASNLTGGAASVDGHFAFASPALIPPVGISPQTVLFIPQDGGTYSMVQGTVDVTVFPAENSAPFPIFMFNFGNEDYVGNNSPAHADGTVPANFLSWQTANGTTVSKEVQLSGGNQTVTAEFRRADGTGANAAVNLAQTSRTGNRSGTGNGVFATALTQSWRSYQFGGAAGRSVGAYFTGLEPGEYDVYAVVHNPILIAAGRTTNVGIGVGSAISGSLAWNHASLTGTSFAASPQTDTWQLGVNYARVRVEVTAENPNIYVIQGGPAAASDEFDYHTLAAVQIVAVQPDEPEPADLYADWAAANDIVGGMADETGGVSNLMRYALGGNADTPLSALIPQMQTEVDPLGLILSLTFYRIDDPLVNYAVWFSEDLADWGASPIWDDFGAHEGVPGFFMIEISTLHDRGFLRLEVTR
ncbi:MAG: PKD domain-containing protein [Opitutales bacterium]|nr:PKD domain-containing protein [Opitutales bacterium]